LFDEALASLRTALVEAREAAKAALADLALEENLAPVRKGARVIREIAWRLREIGADGRICDLIDSQVSAIEGAAGKLAPVDLAGALSGAFDRIEGKITAFDANDTTASSPRPAEASPSEELHEATSSAAATPASAISAATAEAEALAEVNETIETADAAQEAETEFGAATADPAATDEATAAVALEAANEPIDAFDGGDEAVLDMVALEMSAPDTDAAYEPPVDAPGESESCEIEVNFGTEVTFGTQESDAPGEPILATALPIVTPLQLQPSPEPAPELKPKFEPEPAPEPSLGSSLLANGIVSRPRTSKPDPLAPIRRMSQTEKIAFFS
jgi:hypothetical protein